MTSSRTIPGALDYGRFLPDAAAVRGQARLDAKDALRRAMAAVAVAAHDEPDAMRLAALQAAHAVMADAWHLLETTA